MSNVTCISCNLSAFQAPPFEEEQCVLTWLQALPGLNYQCPIRTQVVFALMEDMSKQTSLFDPVIHCFLAVGGSSGARKTAAFVRTRDVYICWVNSSGKMYAIDTDNRSDEYWAGHNVPSYAKRWIGKMPEVITLRSEPIVKEQIHNVIQKFETPYLISHCSSIAHQRPLHMPCPNCLVEHVAATLLAAFIAAMPQPIVPEPIPEPVSGPVITSVVIKMRAGVIKSRPNRADVSIKSNGTAAKVDANEVMHIIDAYAILGANPTNVPVPTTVRISFCFGFEIEFFTEPRMLKQLALLRIWCEHYQKSVFRVEPENADLPITIIREE